MRHGETIDTRDTSADTAVDTLERPAERDTDTSIPTDWTSTDWTEIEQSNILVNPDPDSMERG
jgi:hypothetical protein